MTRATLNPRTGVVTVRGYLPDARILAVTVEPGDGDINFGTWGCKLKDHEHSELKAKFHKLSCLGNDFLNRFEEAVLDAGIAELCDCCLGRTLDDPTIKQIIATVRVILEAAARGPVVLDEAA
jgi:hypothetical protein